MNTPCWFIYTDITLQLNGRFYPNNSLFAFEEIGGSLSTGLVCITNYRNCCRRRETSQNTGLGVWFFPNGTDTTFNSNHKLYSDRHSSSVALIYNMPGEQNAPAGIYHCVIPTDMGRSATVYIGLYPSAQGDPTNKFKNKGYINTLYI